MVGKVSRLVGGCPGGQIGRYIVSICALYYATTEKKISCYGLPAFMFSKNPPLGKFSNVFMSGIPNFFLTAGFFKAAICAIVKMLDVTQ